MNGDLPGCARDVSVRLWTERCSSNHTDVPSQERRSIYFWQDICISVNYPTLPRSGLLAPRLLRVGLPVSVSERAGTGPTAVPDSAGDFPLRVVRSVPLLPNRHLATTAVARFLSSFERPPVFRDDETATPFRTTLEQRRKRGEHLLLPSSTARVVKVPRRVQETRAGGVSPPCSLRSLRKGAYRPQSQLNSGLSDVTSSSGTLKTN